MKTLMPRLRTLRVRSSMLARRWRKSRTRTKTLVKLLTRKVFCSSLSQAEEENGQSRIYLGIHWAFDKTEGIAQGRQVADYVFENAFVPAQGNR